MQRDALCDCDVIHQEAVDAARRNMTTGEEYAQLAALLKLFGDPTRVKILHALEQQELCVAALLDLTKSAVSHQLKTLRLANLVKYRKEGQVAFYALADDHVQAILEMGFEHVRE